jgi:hypothetical protein
LWTGNPDDASAEEPMGAQGRPFTVFTLDNGWNIDFPTDPPGILRLGPGPIRFDARLSGRPYDEAGLMVFVDCEIRLADVDGALWQATASFFSSCLLYPLIDLARPEPPTWLANAPATWREALEQRPLLREIPAYWDDTRYSSLWVDNSFLFWKFNRQGASFTIAALSPDRLVVQASIGLCSWNPAQVAGPDRLPEPLPPARAPATKEERDAEESQLMACREVGYMDTSRPLAYTIEPSRILFLNTEYPVFDMDKGLAFLPVSRPLVFLRKGQGKAQRSVSFLSRARSVVPAGVAPATIPWGALEAMTDTGERLALNNPKGLAIEIDRHPGSDTEQVDILRCRIRVMDEADDIWEGVSLSTPEVFFEKLIDLERQGTLVVESADNPWQPGPDGLLGVRAQLEGGWRYILLERDLIAFEGDEQRPLIDINATGDVVAVRIRGLVGRRRPILLEEYSNDDPYLVLDPPERASEATAWEDDQPLPPLCFSMSLLDLAFRNTTFAIDDGFWHRNAIPIPIVFTRIGKGQP